MSHLNSCPKIRVHFTLPGIHASRIEWGQAVQGSARELLTDPADADESTDHADAVRLLKAELTADCWTPGEVASKALKDAGFTKKQIWNAGKKLNITRKKGGMGEGWYWRLPAGREDSTTPEGFEDSPFQKPEPLKSSGECLVIAPTVDLCEVEL